MIIFKLVFNYLMDSLFAYVKYVIFFNHIKLICMGIGGARVSFG